MNLCKTCKWWKKPEDDLCYGPGIVLIDVLGGCSNPMVNGDFVEARMWGTRVAKSVTPRKWIEEQGIPTEDYHSIPLNTAAAYGDNDRFGFSCGPEFGYVSHKKKGQP
jgi:hypothetical protein